MFDKKLLRKIAVRVSAGNNTGSGFIVPSTEQGRFYCLTAKHCLKEGEIKLTQITDDQKEIVLDYTDIIEDPNEEHDIAIILLKNYSAQLYPHLRIFIGCTNKVYTECGLAGFPKSRDDFDIQKGDIISEDASNYKLTIQLSNANTSLALLKEQLDGFSGGCIFVVDANNEYKLLAIETELADKNAGFNEIIGITLAMANNLLKSNELPQLASPKYRYASMTWGQGRNVLIKEKECHSNSEWVNTKDSDSLINTIQEHFFTEGNKPLLLCGFSGIGKTRTVLQACIQNHELSNAIFFDCYEHFCNIFNTDLRKYFDSSTEEPIYLIVDDVSLGEWNQLMDILKNYNNIRAVTIAEMGQAEIDCSYPTHQMIMQMKPYDESDVKNIIHNHYPLLSDEELKSIFRLSDNDLRFAFLIAKVYSQSERKELWSLHDQRSGKQIVDRIMAQVGNKEYIEIIKIFSLFVDFGYKGSSKQEIDFIKDYFKLNEGILNRAINSCTNRRLGIKRGNYFELSPRAFARILFAENHVFIIKDYSDFMDSLPTDELRRRFIMRAYECGDEIWEEVKDTLVSWFRKKYAQAAFVVSNGIFGKEYVELSVGNTNEAMTYVEFIPDDGLHWLKCLIKNTDGQLLDKFSGYNGRRQFVWTCEKLSCFKEYFKDCEDILFTLSQHETDGGISNNSSGVWSELYGVLISNTEVPFEERFNLLIYRMRNYGNEQNQDMFKSALSHVLSMSGAKLLPPKMVGGRLTPVSWAEQNIRTWGELLENNIYVLTTLNKNADSLPTSMKQAVFEALKDHMAEYTNGGIIISLFKLYEIYCRALEKFAANAEQCSEIVIEINMQLEYEKYSRKNHGNNSVSDQRINELTKWRDSIAQTDLISRIKVCLAETFLHTEERMEKIKSLAIELIESADAPDMLTTILSFDNILDYSFSRFAQALGEVDTSYKLNEVIGENFASGSNSFSENYYFGIYDRLKEMPGFLRQTLRHTIDRNPEGVFRVSVVCDYSNEGTERIIDLVEKGVINNYVLSLGEQWQTRQLSLEQMECILGALVKRHTRDSVFFFFLIGEMWLKASPSAELEDVLYQYTNELPLIECQRNSSNFIKLIELMPRHLSEGLSLVIQSIDYSSHLNTQTEPVLFIKNHSCKQHAEKIAFEVCDCLEAQFEQIPCFTSFSLLINLLDPDMVLKWIECKSANSAKIIAYHLPAPSLDKVNVPEITLKVLERYGNDEKVFHRFLMGIHAFETYTLESVKESSVKTIKVLEDYKNYPLVSICEWAEYEINRIKALIEEKEQLDSEDNRFRDD